MNFASFRSQTGQPLHEQIRQWIVQEIAGYALSAQLPTDRELAEQLGVSPLTVKRALGDLQREGYLVRQRGRGTFVASHERAVHRDSAVDGTNGQVVIAYPNYFSYEYWQRIHHAEEHCVRQGRRLVEFKINPDTSYERLAEFVQECPDVRGLLLTPVPGTLDRATFDLLDGLGIPVVVFQHCDHLALGENVWSVVHNWFAEGYQLVQQLVEAGHHAIGYIANEPRSRDRGEMLRGMMQCLRDHGLRTRDLKTLRGSVKVWQDSVEGGFNLCREMFAEHDPTGLVTDSVAGALGTLHYLWRQGRQVPRDVSLVTGGMLRNYEKFFNPPLTAVSASVEDEVRLAFSVLRNPVKTTGRLLTADVLVEQGESVAAPAPAMAATGGCRLHAPTGGQ